MIAGLILLALSFVSLVGFIVVIIAAKDKKKARFPIAGLVMATIICLVAGVGSIAMNLYANRGKIIEKVVNATSDIASSGLSLAASGFEKNWDKKLMEDIKNVSVRLVSVEYAKSEREGYRKCILKIEINNASSDKNRKIYTTDLFGNNYLVAYDGDDYIHTLTVDRYENDKIPNGKTIGLFKTEIEDNAEIKGLILLGQKIE